VRGASPRVGPRADGVEAIWRRREPAGHAELIREVRQLGGLVRAHVLRAVVTDRVEPLFRVQGTAQVSLGCDDSRLVIQRPRDHLAERRLDHRRAAATEYLAIRRQRRREVVGERGRGNDCGTETTKARDSIAM